MSLDSSSERDLGRVEGKLDLLLAYFTDFNKKHESRQKEVDERHDALELRISKVESRLAMFATAAVVGVVAYLGDAKSLLTTILSKLL